MLTTWKVERHSVLRTKAVNGYHLSSSQLAPQLNEILQNAVEQNLLGITAVGTSFSRVFFDLLRHIPATYLARWLASALEQLAEFQLTFTSFPNADAHENTRERFRGLEIGLCQPVVRINA